jgi:hypothetical protein
MTNLKDQIEENIRKERERSEKIRRNEYEDADKARKLFDDIRPKLDELSHTTDQYSLKVGYAKGPYAEVIAVVELNDTDGTWVAAWHIGTTVGDPIHDWEVAYNPRGVETQHEWFANSDDLFKYLTASIAERIVEMEADEG